MRMGYGLRAAFSRCGVWIDDEHLVAWSLLNQKIDRVSQVFRPFELPMLAGTERETEVRMIP
jgi:hypothetical protein